MLNIQHPDITAMERTGYPRRHRPESIIECSVCGCEMVLDQVYGEPTCEFCEEVVTRYEGDEPA